ncbi:DUF3043 domain-containing protein [Myceligenerans indicum]|uniref:DUF3043 domain-containing protein n=1 Tax=Myceligenerans indicum TaxID=2593663 RepID=UPI0027DE8497|nr:DUF3043 domain-containing protein [Myceligenerans indicum]
MFSRSKSTNSDVTPVGDTPDEVTEQPSSGKGRATPKRKDAQAANKRPLVPDDRKAARQAAREKERKARDLSMAAMQNPTDPKMARHLPPRDKGQVKAYARDHVDARWNLGEFFLPVAVVMLLGSFLANQLAELTVVLFVGMYGFLFLTIVDAVVMWRGLKKRLLAKFGEVPGGTMMYAVSRSYQIRRSRLPRPTSKKHGNFPS